MCVCVCVCIYSPISSHILSYLFLYFWPPIKFFQIPVHLSASWMYIVNLDSLASFNISSFNTLSPARYIHLSITTIPSFSIWKGVLTSDSTLSLTFLTSASLICASSTLS